MAAGGASASASEDVLAGVAGIFRRKGAVCGSPKLVPLLMKRGRWLATGLGSLTLLVIGVVHKGNRESGVTVLEDDVDAEDGNMFDVRSDISEVNGDIVTELGVLTGEIPFVVLGLLKEGMDTPRLLMKEGEDP